jgi:hypothetical protein
MLSLLGRRRRTAFAAAACWPVGRTAAFPHRARPRRGRRRAPGLGARARRRLGAGGLAAGAADLVTGRGRSADHRCRDARRRPGPFSNQYEFAVSFSWGMVVATAIARRRFKMPMVRWPRSAALAMLPFISMPAWRWSRTGEHVAADRMLAAVLPGAAAVSCGAAVQPAAQGDRRRRPDSTRSPTGRSVRHRLGHLLVSGPPETSALMTWLLYGGYLHTGIKAACLSPLASVLFTSSQPVPGGLQEV